MMNKTTFAVFLNEAKQTKYGIAPAMKLTFADALKFAKANCQTALKEDEPLMFRGIEITPGQYILDQSTHIRNSANTSNEYTLVIDNSPEWNNFPKRSQSLICASRGAYSYAQDFGEMFIIIPTEECVNKIGIASNSDFWGSFGESLESYFGVDMLDDMNHTIRAYLEQATKDDFKLPKNNTDFRLLKKAFKEIEKYFKKSSHKLSQRERDMFKEIIDGKISFLAYVQRALDPHKNGLIVAPYSKLASIGDDSKRELWVSGKCLAIPVNGVYISNELNNTKMRDSLYKAEQVYNFFRTEVLS
jgi:hypothetical protein